MKKIFFALGIAMSANSYLAAMNFSDWQRIIAWQQWYQRLQARNHQSVKPEPVGEPSENQTQPTHRPQTRNAN